MTPTSSLDRVETLLGEALEDLKHPKREAPAARCAAALAEAAAELQAFAQVSGGIGSQSAPLRTQLGGLYSRLRRLERLLASAAEFYRGWCAAGTQADSYPAPCYLEEGYQSASWSNPGPALLAFRG